MNPVRVPSLSFSILLALAAAGCQQDLDQQDPDPPVLDESNLPFSNTWDSAGINIVENARPADTTRLDWLIGPDPSLTIGRQVGEEAYLLHYAWDATRLPDGRIVVADRASSQLRVFDSTGTHVATWSGRGEGPGEFPPYQLGDVEPWPGDSIVAWYSSGWRVAVFDSEGNFGRSFLGPGINQASYQVSRPRLVRKDGTVLAVHDPESADTALVEIRGGDGGLVASLGYHPKRQRLYFSRELRLGLWGNLVMVSSNDKYELKAFADDGSLVRIVRREHESRVPRPADILVSPTLRPELRIPLEEEMRKVPQSQLAPNFPAFAEVMSDAAGYLWVQEFDPPRERRPVPLWTVFNPEGRVLGFVETPPGLEIYEIGEDYILGHAEDELGVEYVQVWPLERSGA